MPRLLRGLVRPAAIYGLVRELRASRLDERPLAVGGAPELARALARELARGGAESAVRVGGDPRGALVLVYVVAGGVGEAQEAELRAADRAGVPVVALLAEPAAAEPRGVPYVRETDVVRARAGEGFPVAALAAAVARRAGEAGAGLAARLPALRDAVCAELVRAVARRNAAIAALPLLPGADLPVLTLNQVRLVLRIAQAHGHDVDARRIPELLGVLGAGVGFRTVAAELLDLVPVAGWALKGGVAYAGTRTLGEAAVRYFAARTSGAVRAGS